MRKQNQTTAELAKPRMREDDGKRTEDLAEGSEGKRRVRKEGRCWTFRHGDVRAYKRGGERDKCLGISTSCDAVRLWYINSITKETAESGMKREELWIIRHYLGKTQREMAQLLGISERAMASFEKGWRRIPVHVQRQALFLLTMKMRGNGRGGACWDVKNCSVERRNDCPAWEFQCGDLCWFINGTICQGGMQKNWQKKMKICRECEVLRSSLSSL